MSRYRLEIRPSVEKTLWKIRDAKLQQRLDDAFDKLAENPRRMGAEKMGGFENQWADLKIVTASASEITGSSTKFTTPSCWF